jgi:SRSO17 transposase
LAYSSSRPATLADLPRTNCWTIAEHAGDASADGMQHLLGRAIWNAEAVRDDVRTYVVEHLGDAEAVLVVDETGDLKKGSSTVGVQRQYTGAAGKTDNAQVGVYLIYGTQAGDAPIDRELYLPRSWTQDPDRCRAVGVPDQVAFATKPALATRRLTRALDAGVVAGWMTGDEVYGPHADPADPATNSATCSLPWSPWASPNSATGCAGRCGDADIRHAPAPACHYRRQGAQDQ